MNSLLSIVEAADNLPAHPTSPYPTHSADGSERYVPFHLTFADFQASLPPIGLLRPSVLAELQADDGEEEGSPWQFYLTASSSGTRNITEEDKENMDVDEGDDLDLEVQCCLFADWVVKRGGEEMGRILQTIADKWRKEGKFEKQLAGEWILNILKWLSRLTTYLGWRNEQYQIYASPKSTFFTSQSLEGSFANKVFTLERAACALFGFATYGVHLTAYEGEGENMKLWVPRRSKTKPTYPGMLDNVSTIKL